jgi:sortase A
MSNWGGENMNRKIFGTILIVVGLAIIGSAFYMRYSAENKQKQMMQAFQRSLLDLGSDESNAFPEARPQEATPAPSQKASSINVKPIAIMVIPKLNLEVAVAEGTDNQTLKYAVGHFKDTARPGEKGNFAVAGHRSYTYNEYFNRLDELVSGDEIIVKTKEKEFTYVVYDKQVVEPHEVSVLNPTKDATITLVTCTPIRVATHRLIIKGRLK